MPNELLTLAMTPGEIFTADNMVALLTLTLLEIVLGIDNIVFIAILSGRLPAEQRGTARRTGLALALVTRILLLTTLASIIRLADVGLFTLPWFTEHFVDKDGHGYVDTMSVSGKDLILLLGGAFLIWKATKEIHHKLEDEPDNPGAGKPARFWPVIGQILVIDIVFSLDSVITAVGMAQALWVMVTAVVVSVGVMLAFATPISNFIERHPSMKMLALSFLILIGVVLIADGLGQHISKGYIYFAMAFSLLVEMLNIATRRKKRSHPHPPAPAAP